MDSLLALFSTPATYVSLTSLILLEVVLGIDNIIFISILAGKLPPEQRPRARFIGLMLALVGRLLLLFSIAWLVGLTKPWLVLGPWSFSGKDLVLLAGGLFLIGKSANEIHHREESNPEEDATRLKRITFRSVIIQIILIDMVFSLDSILTAVGLVKEIAIMVVAVLVSIGIMLMAAGPISEFIDRHPSVKVLALAFLLMIGTLLVAEAFHFHMPREYIYFSLAFALFVEFLNIRAGTRTGKNS